MPESHTFLTFSGSTHRTEEVGFLSGVGKYIAGDGKVNIISQSRLEEDGFKVAYCGKYRCRCAKGSTELHFVRGNVLYVYTDISPMGISAYVYTT